jgi:hypothetical protein
VWVGFSGKTFLTSLVDVGRSIRIFARLRYICLN